MHVSENSQTKEEKKTITLENEETSMLQQKPLMRW